MMSIKIAANAELHRYEWGESTALELFQDEWSRVKELFYG